MRSQAIRGKYVAMQMPRKKKEEQPQQVPQIPQQNFFAEVNYLVDQPNSFNQGFIELIFSEWLRTLKI